MSKKILILGLIIFSTVILFNIFNKKAIKKIVAINQFISDPALDSTAFPEIAKLAGLKVITSPVNFTTDVKIAVHNLVDIIYVLLDKLVIPALNRIVKIALEHKVPVIANDPKLINKGLLDLEARNKT